MHLPLGAFVNPAANEIHLLFIQRPLRVWRRHALGLVGCADALVEFALRSLARHDHLVSAAIREDSIFGVQAQLGHALFFVGTMAGEAGIGENRPDFAIEIHGLGGGFTRWCGGDGPDERKKQGARSHMVG